MRAPIIGLLLLLVATPASAGEGVSATEIVLGSSTSLSGPRAWSGEQATKFGVDLYLRVVNESGGIEGRKVRTVYRDDGGVPEAAEANTRKLVAEDGVLAVIAPQGERTILAALPYLEQGRVPLLFPLGGSPALRGRKYVFGATMLYDRQARLMADYLAGQRKYRRFAAIYQNDAYGKVFLAGLTTALERRGATLVGSERIGWDVQDVAAPVARLRALRPDVTVLVSPPRAGGAVLKERLRIGWSETVMVAAGPLLDEVTSDRPGVKRYREHLVQHFPGTPPNRASLSGYFAAMLFTEAARRAGRALTRESLVAALEGLRDWVRMEQGRFKPLTDWLRGG